jgi:hypothetical protein
MFEVSGGCLADLHDSVQYIIGCHQLYTKTTTHSEPMTPYTKASPKHTSTRAKANYKNAQTQPVNVVHKKVRLDRSDLLCGFFTIFYSNNRNYSYQYDDNGDTIQRYTSSEEFG